MSQVQGIRLAGEEVARYKRVAAEAGLSFNAWARRALRGRADLDEALRRQEERRQRPAWIPLEEAERVRRGLPADLDEAMSLGL